MDSVQLLVEHIDQPGVIAIAKEDPDLPDDTYWAMMVLVPGTTDFAQSRFPIARNFEWSKKKNWRPFSGQVVWSVKDGRIQADAFAQEVCTELSPSQRGLTPLEYAKLTEDQRASWDHQHEVLQKLCETNT